MLHVRGYVPHVETAGAPCGNCGLHRKRGRSNYQKVKEKAVGNRSLVQMVARARELARPVARRAGRPRPLESSQIGRPRSSSSNPWEPNRAKGGAGYHRKKTLPQNQKAPASVTVTPFRRQRRARAPGASTVSLVLRSFPQLSGSLFRSCLILSDAQYTIRLMLQKVILYPVEEQSRRLAGLITIQIYERLCNFLWPGDDS